MRADRLISILMLLQARGKMTASALAEELEVSERTIYRDVEALSLSGVPLFAEHGPGGGLALLDSYRTNLTGLDEDELRALFMMSSVSGPLDKLGIHQDLKSAVLKLSAALPDARRSDEMIIRQRFYLDWSWWFHAQEPVPYLMVLQQTIWEDRRVRLFYRTFLTQPVEVVVEPYGLVAKAGIWYLVARVAGGMRVYRVSILTNVTVLDDCFNRSTDFDLPAFWQRWCMEYEENQQVFLAELRVSPALTPLLPLYFGRRIVDLISKSSSPDAEGWITLNLPFESLESARDRILGFGSSVEILGPEALRCSVLDYAQQIVQFYAQRKQN